MAAGGNGLVYRPGIFHLARDLLHIVDALPADWNVGAPHARA